MPNKDPHSIQAQKFIIQHGKSGGTLLDVGCGTKKTHTKAFEQAGFKVTTSDSNPQADPDRLGDFMSVGFAEPFDVVWAAHVLEHQPNVQQFLYKVSNLCRPDGLISITVPPLKHRIVGGHLSLWNAGLLLYNLVFSGIDCRDAAVLTYGYNISVVVQNKVFDVAAIDLKFDSPDIELLKRYFPAGIQYQRNKNGLSFDGDIKKINWE